MEDKKPGELDNVQFLNDAWKASDDVWKTRRTVFDESWGLFHNRYDFSKKAAWQSKNFAPKMNRMIRSAAYAFKDALVGVTDYFSVNGVGKKSRERSWVAAKLLKYWLDKNDFVNKLVDSLFASLLSSLMVFKVYCESYTDEEVVEADKTYTGAEALSAALNDVPQANGAAPGELKTKPKVKWRLRVDAIDPNRVRIDPTGRRKYIIHEYEMDLHDLRELAKAPSNRYEKEVVDSITEDFRKSDESEVREKLRRNETLPASTSTFRKAVTIREYWGEVFDKEGKLIGRNMTFSVANEKYLIRKPFKNPYFVNELPFVWAAPMRVPFSNFHQSFAENINGLCRMATEILNLTLDANLWASLKAFVLDLDQVVDPNEFKSGVYPGKVFKARSRGVPRAMVTPVEMGVVNPQNLTFGGAIERETQNATGITEYAAGFVGARKNELATEINVKSAQSFGYLNSIAREVEENALDKVLEKMWTLIVTHMDDFTDEKLKEMLGDDVSEMLVFLDETGRREYLSGSYEFRFRGMSSMLEKGKELEKVQLVTNSLQAVPGLAQDIDPRALTRKLFSALNWNPEELMRKESAPTPPPGIPSAMPPGAGAPGAPGGAPPEMMSRILAQALG